MISLKTLLTDTVKLKELFGLLGLKFDSCEIYVLLSLTKYGSVQPRLLHLTCRFNRTEIYKACRVLEKAGLAEKSHIEKPIGWDDWTNIEQKDYRTANKFNFKDFTKLIIYLYRPEGFKELIDSRIIDLIKSKEFFK